jgi:hypothetical protein
MKASQFAQSLSRFVAASIAATCVALAAGCSMETGQEPTPAPAEVRPPSGSVSPEAVTNCRTCLRACLSCSGCNDGSMDDFCWTACCGYPKPL